MKTGRKKGKRCRWGQRWKNRRPDGTYVPRGKNWTAWRRRTCPHCGRKYYWFRMPCTREDVLAQLRMESDRGDIPSVTLRTLLGRCHEVKMQAWEAHVALCGGFDVELDENGKPDPDDLERCREFESRAGRFVTTDRRVKKRKRKKKPERR